MWKEYREFIARGNVIDLAVGLIMGAAFGKIVTTLVEGVIMPPLGLLVRSVDFSSLFIVLDPSQGVPASFADAKAKGIPVIAYGQLLNDIVTSTIVGFAVFLLVKQVNKLRAGPEQNPSMRNCPYCTMSIPIKATRCPQCTSALN